MRDRRLVEVQAVDEHARVGPRDLQRREPRAAGDVGDAGGRVGPQPGVDRRDRRQPLRPQRGHERDPVHVALAFAEVGRVVGVRDAVAGPERLQDARERTGDVDHHARERRHVGRAVAVEQDLGVARGERVAAVARCGAVLDDVENPAHGLVLVPLAHVALVRAGGVRDLGRGARPGLGQRPVEAEAVAEVDDMEVVEAEAGLQEPAREGVAPGALAVVEGGPRAAPARAAWSRPVMRPTVPRPRPRGSTGTPKGAAGPALRAARASPAWSPGPAARGRSSSAPAWSRSRRSRGRARAAARRRRRGRRRPARPGRVALRRRRLGLPPRRRRRRRRALAAGRRRGRVALLGAARGRVRPAAEERRPGVAAAHRGPAERELAAGQDDGGDAEREDAGEQRGDDGAPARAAGRRGPGGRCGPPSRRRSPPARPRASRPGPRRRGRRRSCRASGARSRSPAPGGAAAR